jgi:hypothetical protein
MTGRYNRVEGTTLVVPAASPTFQVIGIWRRR